MLFRQLYDADSSTYTYLLADEETNDAVLIDPVREQLERDLTLIDELGLRLRFVLDTHVHADHVTASGLLREKTGAKTVVGVAAGAGCADVRLAHGDTVRFGRYELEARATPGHTRGCMSYVCHVANMVFTGDALLIRACGRTDFQEGDAGALYDSVYAQLFSLPDATLVYPAHDYKGRTVSTVGEEKRLNARLGGARSKGDFVRLMSELKLAYPKRMDEAVPANLKCGLPQARAHQADPRESWAPVMRGESGAPEVSAAWVASGGAKECDVVDVRQPDELRGELGALSSCRNVPLDGLERAAASWERDRPLVIVCRSGQRSAQAAIVLERMGFSKVASMRGGMLAYRALVRP